MNEEKQTEKKEWHKTPLGIALIIFLFPIVFPIFVWTRTNWNKNIKIGITVFCGFIILSSFIASAIEEKKQEEMNQVRAERRVENQNKAVAIIDEAKTKVQENNLDEAKMLIAEAKKLDSTNQEVIKLEAEFNKLNSDEYLKESLISLSDEEFEQLKNGQLNKKFISSENINKAFIEKLEKNQDKRIAYKMEQEKKEKEERDAKRQEEIEKQFSAWDGSHVKLTQMIKDSMNDPKSYEHVETKYWDMEDHIVVSTTFRGKNAFGGTVKNSVKAKISIDGEDIEVIEQF